MNGLKLSFVATAMLLLVGCGGGGSTSTPEATKVETIDDAKSSFQSLSALDSKDRLINQINSEKLQKTSFSKPESYNCDNGGTISIESNGNSFSMVANQCKYDSYYINGTVNSTELSDGSEKLTMSNLTMKDGEIDMTASQMVIVENESEFWSTIDGDIQIVSKCFSGNYNFKTIEKIYDAQDGSDNIERGVLELNGARYTFDNPNVTIKVGDSEETISQSELEKRMNNTTTCSE